MHDRTEKENQEWIRRVRRENARKEALERELAENPSEWVYDRSIESMFRPFGVFRMDTEGDSSLMV
jgi:hypothetical protein